MDDVDRNGILEVIHKLAAVEDVRDRHAYAMYLAFAIGAGEEAEDWGNLPQEHRSGWRATAEYVETNTFIQTINDTIRGC
jgi:hypothetical protein